MNEDPKLGTNSVTVKISFIVTYFLLIVSRYIFSYFTNSL